MRLGTVLHFNDALHVVLHTLSSVLNLWISLVLLNSSEVSGFGIVSLIFVSLNYVVNALLLILLRREVRRATVNTIPLCLRLPTPILFPLAGLLGCITPFLGLLTSSCLRRSTLLDRDISELARNAAWSVVPSFFPKRPSADTSSETPSSLAVQEELAGIDQSVTLVQILRLVMEHNFPQHLLFYSQSIIEGIPLFLIQLIALSRGILPGHLVPLVWVSMGSAIVSLLLKSYIGCQSLDPLVCLIRFLFIVYDVNAMIFTIVYMATVGAPGGGESVLTMGWLILVAVIACLVLSCLVGFALTSFNRLRNVIQFLTFLIAFAVPLSCAAAFMKFISVSYAILRLQPRVQYGGAQAATFAFLRQGNWDERLRFLLFTTARRKDSQTKRTSKLEDCLPSPPRAYLTEIELRHTEEVNRFIRDEQVPHTSLANSMFSRNIDLVQQQSVSSLGDWFRAWSFRLAAIGQLVTTLLFPWVAIVHVALRSDPTTNGGPAQLLYALTGVAAILLLTFVPLSPRLYKYSLFCLEYEQLESWCRSMEVDGPWGRNAGKMILTDLGTYFRPTAGAVLRCCLGSGSSDQAKGGDSGALMLIPDDIVDRLSTFLPPDAIDVSGLSRTEVFQMKVNESDPIMDELTNNEDMEKVTETRPA
jgi:hypothetical protein